MKNFKGWYSKFEDFIPKEHTVDELDLHIVGHFPYETASLPFDIPAIPSILLAPMLRKVGRDCDIHDNKFVIVAKATGFIETKLAFYVKDGWVRIGTWDQIKGYGANKLKTQDNGTSSPYCSCDLPNYIGLSLDTSKPCPYCKLPFKKH